MGGVKSTGVCCRAEGAVMQGVRQKAVEETFIIPFVFLDGFGTDPR